jgi:hypothetical protein
MTGKAGESPSLSSPLADETLYVSPQGNYRIKASADGSALWIVPTHDPSRRKLLPGADPDDFKDRASAPLGRRLRAPGSPGRRRGPFPRRPG